MVCGEEVDALLDHEDCLRELFCVVHELCVGYLLGAELLVLVVLLVALDLGHHIG